MATTYEHRESSALAEEKLNEIRQSIDEYRALSFGRKIVWHLTRQYPPYDARHQLAQHDMAPFDKVKQQIGYKTFGRGYFKDKPPFMEDDNYHKLLSDSDHLAISRYVSVRCNPVVGKFIYVVGDSRTGESRVDEPWYAGLYRQVIRAGSFRNYEQAAIGIFLTDKTGVQFETVELRSCY